MKRTNKIVGGIAALSILINIVLIFMVIHTRTELRNVHVSNMSAVAQDLFLTDLNLNEHKKVSGTPEYLISGACALLQQSGYFNLTVALGNAEDAISHPQNSTQTEVSRAKKFIHTFSTKLHGTLNKNGMVRYEKASNVLENISMNIPSNLR